MKSILYLRYLVFLIALLSCPVFAQHTIKGTFSGPIAIQEISLEQYGLKPTVIATSKVNNNTFQLTIPNHLTKGVYKLLYKTTQASSGFDLLVNNKADIEFTMPLSSNQFTPPQFSKSEQNNLWFNYQQQFSISSQKIAVLKQAWQQYPNKTDDIIQSIEKSIQALITDRRNQLNELKKSAPFIALLLANSQPQEVFNSTVSEEQLDDYFIGQYWTGIETNNTVLLNTPIFNNLIFQYINLHLKKYQNETKSIQNKALKTCIDQVLKHFTQKETKSFAINYLSQGFKQLGNEDVLQYIDETYALAEQCERPDALNMRLEGYKKLKPGNLAPAILNAGKNMLQSKTGKQTLLVFWASWCPHCMQEIPELNRYAKANDLSLVAVSLDTEKESYLQVKNELTSMTHYCDYKKWESIPVKDYYIKGTPTYFLIDKDGRILQKYTSVQEVKQHLSKS